MSDKGIIFVYFVGVLVNSILYGVDIFLCIEIVSLGCIGVFYFYYLKESWLFCKIIVYRLILILSILFC